MKEKLEKLAALWPQDSVWEARIGDSPIHALRGGGGVFWLYRKGSETGCPVCDQKRGICIDPDAFMFAGGEGDMECAVARTIIEDELRRLGYAIVMDSTPNEWVYTASNSEWGPEAGAPTRTEALVDVAIAVLEASIATQPPIENGTLDAGAQREATDQATQQGDRRSGEI